MNPRISVALLSAAMLAGCGFSDSSNYAGGAFLDAQGESVSSRANASLAVSTRSVEYLPPEGYPSLPGKGPVVVGAVGSDSIRAVVGYDLHSTTSWGGPDALRKLPLQSVTFRIRSATWKPKLRLRMALAQGNGISLPALYMGVEPQGLPGIRLILDTVVAPTVDADKNISIPVPQSVTDSILATSGADLGWLAVILDPLAQSGSEMGLVQIDSLPFFKMDSKYALMPVDSATRSIQMRASGSPTEVIGWWAGSGRRARLELDGDAIRASLHRQVPAEVSTPEMDNSYHILQARASLGFQAFSAQPSTAKALIITRVVEREASSRFPLETTLEMPSTLMNADEVGGSVAVRCTTLVSEVLADCYLTIGGQVQERGTRLAYGSAYFTGVHQSHFWLRLDVPDQAEFPVLTNVRLSIASVNTDHGPAELRAHWTRLHLAYNADSQYDSTSWRSNAQLGSNSDRIELEIRTALSQVVQQKTRKVFLDLTPYAVYDKGLDLWTARSSSSSQWIDSIRVLVRPRDGGNI